MNKQIKSKTVRLVNQEGQQVGILDLEEALAQARAEGLDLVEVAPGADPPVCKLMDFGKYKYKLGKRQQHTRSHPSQLKSLRLHPKTEEHDIQVRLKQARKFLEKRHKVQIYVDFKGPELRHTDAGELLLNRFLSELEDVAKVERAPHLEGRRMSLLLAAK